MGYVTIKPDQNICSYHNDMIELARELQNIKPRHYDNIEDALDDVQTLAYKIEQAGEYALVCGQNMEDRLTEYKDAIESLGFKRIKP